MAKGSSRSATITGTHANPQNEQELKQSISAMANALQGTYATGEFDGGIGGTGFYHKYAYFWDAKLVTSAAGSTTITFPFTMDDTLVYQTSISDTGELTVHTINVHNSKSFPATLSGVKTIFEVSMVRNVKEA